MFIRSTFEIRFRGTLYLKLSLMQRTPHTVSNEIDIVSSLQQDVNEAPGKQGSLLKVNF